MNIKIAIKINVFATFSLLFLVLSTASQAKPSKLVIYKSEKKVHNSHIRKAHTLIEHDLPMPKVRFAILLAAFSNQNIRWLIEEEGEGYMIFRWDNARTTIYNRVEYDEKNIQIKYHDSLHDYKCENNVDGICYFNELKRYYVFTERLKNSITNAIQSL